MLFWRAPLHRPVGSEKSPTGSTSAAMYHASATFTPSSSDGHFEISFGFLSFHSSFVAYLFFPYVPLPLYLLSYMGASLTRKDIPGKTALDWAHSDELRKWMRYTYVASVSTKRCPTLFLCTMAFHKEEYSYPRYSPSSSMT